MQRGFFVFVFFIMIFGKPKKKTLKINSDKQVKSKKKTKQIKTSKPNKETKKVMYLNL